MSHQVVETESRLFLSSRVPSAWTVTRWRTERPPSAGAWKTRRRVSRTAHPDSCVRYAIAIESSWSPAATIGTSSRFIDSALK